MLVNDGNLHRTLSHINTCSIFDILAEVRLQNCTAQLFCSLPRIVAIQYLFPYASSSKHWHGNAWYVGPHGPRYWDATHLGSKFHSKLLEAIDLRESPGQDPRKPWRAAQISSQRFDACRYLRVNALTSCQHIMRYDAISTILCYEKACQLSGLVCFHCIFLIAFWPCGCIKIQGWGMLKDDN